MSCDWEGNRRSGVALAMRHRVMKVGLVPGDFVLHGDPALLTPKKGAEPPPPFSAHVYCGQTAGRIKMVLGIEVGLSQGNFVLDGDPAPSL